MDVIALISGGKDSFFSILHCIKNGHRIVALANLHPPEVDSPSIPRITTHLPSHDVNTPIPSILSNVEKDELDSFLYQTIGHNLLPYYATALNIPLYRTPIIGSAVNQNLAYKLERKDETEDLYRLLKYVQQRHPSASGVSSGAILSTYQRTRVENVCMRLDLTSLAYLWQRPQHLLLDDMASVNLDARIVKVATIGFEPDSFLWQNVTSPQVRRKLRALKDRWGVHIAGEGGEYETIVVEGPGWRIRIVVNNEKGDAYQVVLGGGENGVGHLKILKATGERVGNGAGEDQANWVKNLRQPQPLNYYFQRILEGLRSGEVGGKEEQPQKLGKRTLPPRGLQTQIFITSHTIDNNIIVNNLSVPHSKHEMEDIMSLLASHLARYHTNPNSETEPEAWSVWFSKITQITILLRSMDDFSSVNTIYNRYFRDPNPPSRVCVAIGDAMPPGCNIVMHVQAIVSGGRKGLHIQGRSYWAPANIGPYSQAISTQGLVYISGQIPLSPATMQLPTIVGALGKSITASLEFQTVLAMQHMWRVARATKVSGYVLVLGFTTTYKGMQVMSRAWRGHVSPGLSEMGDCDQGGEDYIPNPRLWMYGQDEDVIDQTPYEDEAYVPSEVKAAPHITSIDIPPLLICQVPELPRGAPVEWVALGIDAEYIPRRCHKATDDGDSDCEDSRYGSYKWTIEDENVSEDVQYHVRTWCNNQVSYGSVLQFGTNDTIAKAATLLFKFLSTHKEGLLPYVATVYLALESNGETGEFCLEWERLCKQSYLRELLQIVPVQKVWFREKEVIVGVAIRYLRPNYS